jgi:CBS domain-containing protein
MRTAEEILEEKNRSIISVTSDVTIFEALQIMVKNNIGAILIKENDKIIGIYTERDLLRNTVIKGFDPQKAMIRDYMITDLVCASHDDPLYKLQDKLLGKYLRHIIIVKEGKYIGLLSAGDITRAGLIDIAKNLKSASWDYYENWHWGKNK